MAAVLYWRLPEPAPTNPGPLPWLPGIPSTLHDHPVWGNYLAKRSQLVADLADQVQDHACQGDALPAWAAPGAHPTAPDSAKSRCGGPPTASIPKTRAQPEQPNSKLSRPCGNNASTGISRVPPTGQQMRGPTSHRQDAPHSVQATSGSARTKDPNGVRAGRPRPADSTPQPSHRGARNMRLHSARRWQDRQHTAESGSSFQIKAPRSRPAGAAVLLRAGLAPAFCGRGDVTQGRRAAGARARGACTRPAGCGRRRSGARPFRGRRPGSRRRCVLRPWPR